MASFISALALLILVLANGCFTLPVVDEQLWSSTLSSLTNDLTTEKVLNLALVSDDDTTGLPSMEPKRSAYEHAEFGMSNSTDSLLIENASRASRAFDELTTSESFPDKRDHDELLLTTVESTTQVLEHALRTLKSSSEDEIEPETETGKGDYQKSWSTEVESNGQSSKRESQTLKINSEDGNIKSDIPVELTTSFMPSFTSTSSAVAPELYTSESSTSTSTSSSTSTSTEKYTGHLPHEVEAGEEPQHREKVEDEEEQQKPLKKQTKTKLESKVTPIRKSKIQSEDEPEEDLKESKFKISTTRKPKIQSEDKPEEDLKETPFKISTTRKPKVQSEDKPEEDLKESQIKISTTRKPKVQTEDKPEEDLKESQFKISTTRKPKVQTEDKPAEYFEESQSKISTTRKSKVQPAEDSKESSFPTAVFDQDASNKVSNVPNDFMMLDETDSPIVTDRPDKLSTVTVANQTKPKLLNQGKKSSQPEEKESDH